MIKKVFDFIFCAPLTNILSIKKETVYVYVYVYKQSRIIYSKRK